MNTTSSERIVTLLTRFKSGLTTNQLQQILNLPPRTINRVLNYLRKANRIVRSEDRVWKLKLDT